MKLMLVILCLLLWVCSPLHREHNFNVRQCRKVNYTFNSLVLSWPGQFCSEKSCVRGWNSNWNGRDFTIHGYWPSSADLSYLTCFEEQGYDPFCYQEFDFNSKLFPKTLYNDMLNLWPQLQGGNSFWKYQWDKHGTCYLFKNKENGETTSDNDIFINYFTKTVEKAKKYNNLIRKNKYNTQKQLSIDLKLKEDQFYAICGFDNELDQIRICYSFSAKSTQQEQVRSCPKSNDKSKCQYPITLPQFK